MQQVVGRTACPAGELCCVFEAFSSANTNEEFNPDDTVSYWEFRGWSSRHRIAVRQPGGVGAANSDDQSASGTFSALTVAVGLRSEQWTIFPQDSHLRRFPRIRRGRFESCRMGITLSAAGV